ncbi:MAG: hypothetical protein A2603_16765 [Bdellovibrionales bacterium RIFOXYD1_FULL_55_31]|nr:MAG: hypothetical protein A2603_16765 [Bdellovibrionales bacterium RIFOXYD1_FULL_55_31]
MMDKGKVIEQISRYLEEERASLMEARDFSRAEEMKGLILMYRFLPKRTYGAEDVVCPASLVEMELNGVRAFYFIAPRGGGLVTSVDGLPVQVITPQSPIGEAVLGRRAGETVRIELRDGVREYRIVGMS